ncbi:helix-turn-helix transcriptional regulator [Ancylomarina sp. YFZ004]
MLHREFKSLTNTNLKEYLCSIRLPKARELLMTSELNSTQATYATGFKDIFHFSIVFTQEFGMNPSKIRN